jgi:hypothetical protein
LEQYEINDLMLYLSIGFDKKTNYLLMNY